MCILTLSTNFVWNISHSKKNWARYDKKMYMDFIWCICYSCQVLMNLENFQQIFEKYPAFKFHENPSGESRVVSWRQMKQDRQI